MGTSIAEWNDGTTMGADDPRRFSSDRLAANEGGGTEIEMEEQTMKPVEELSFREAMAELDGIVNVLESNTLELEESLVRYERGVALLASLKKRLTEAEQKVNVLMGELSGEKDDVVRDTTLS
jgi:exodeoxyribonuclease VII small subunit